MSLLQEELDQQQRLIQALLRRKVCSSAHCYSEYSPMKYFF